MSTMAGTAGTRTDGRSQGRQEVRAGSRARRDRGESRGPGSYTVYVSNCIIENDVSWSSSRPFQASKTPSSRYPRGVRRHTTTLLIILECIEAI
jgi:hypothetical protein